MIKEMKNIIAPLITMLVLCMVTTGAWAATTTSAGDKTGIFQGKYGAAADVTITESADDTIDYEEIIYLDLPEGATFTMGTAAVSSTIDVSGSGKLTRVNTDPYSNGVHTINGPKYLTRTGQMELTFDGSHYSVTTPISGTDSTTSKWEVKDTSGGKINDVVTISYYGKPVIQLQVTTAMATNDIITLSVTGQNVPMLTSTIKTKTFTDSAGGTSEGYSYVPGTMVDKSGGTAYNRVMWKCTDATEKRPAASLTISNMYYTIGSSVAVGDFYVTPGSTNNNVTSDSVANVVVLDGTKDYDVFAVSKKNIKVGSTGDAADIHIKERVIGAISAGSGTTKSVIATLPSGITLTSGATLELSSGTEMKLSDGTSSISAGQSTIASSLGTANGSSMTFYVTGASSGTPAEIILKDLNFTVNGTSSEGDIAVDIGGTAGVDDTVVPAAAKKAGFTGLAALTTIPTVPQNANGVKAAGILIAENFGNDITSALTAEISVTLPDGCTFAEDLTMDDKKGGTIAGTLEPTNQQLLDTFTVDVTTASGSSSAVVRIDGPSSDYDNYLPLNIGPDVPVGDLNVTVTIKTGASTTATHTIKVAEVVASGVTYARVSTASAPTLGIGATSTAGNGSLASDAFQIKLTEVSPASLGAGKTIVFTLSDGAQFVNAHKPNSPSATQSGVTISGTAVLSNANKTATFTVTNQNSSTSPGIAILDLYSLKVNADTLPGEINVTLSGTSGITGTVKIADTAYTSGAKVDGDPVSINAGQVVQAVQKIVVTENYPQALNSGAEFKLIAPTGISFSEVPTVTITAGESTLTAGTSSLTDTLSPNDTLIVGLDSQSPSSARIITITNLSLNVSGSVANGPVTLQLVDAPDCTADSCSPKTDASAIRSAYLTPAYVGAVPVLTVSPTAITVGAGETETFTVTSTDESDSAPNAASSDSSKATVTMDGLTGTIKGITEGTVTVTVTGNHSGIQKTIAVTIDPAPALMVTSPESGTLSVKASETGTISLSGGLTPYTASSSDDAVATASVTDKNVTVTGQASGTATITVEDAEGTQVTVDVTVTIGVTASPATIEIKTEAGMDSFDVAGGTAPYKIETSSSTIASIDVESLEAAGTVTVTAGKNGTATITVTDADSDTDTVTVTVNVPTPPQDPPKESTPQEEQLIAPDNETAKADAKVYLGSGTSQVEGSNVEIRTVFPPYTAGVDIIIAVMVPPNYDMFAVNSDNQLVPFADPLPFYAVNQTEELNAQILPPMPAYSVFPAYDMRGVWYVAYMVYPHDDPSTYELIIYSFTAK